MKSKRRSQQPSSTTNCCIGSTAAISQPRIETLCSEVQQLLTNLAEDLGRLTARRMLEAKRNNRRGYSLIDLVLGAAIMAMATLLIHQFWR